MKLKTKCSAHTIHGSMDDFEHDAAMAHALWQAMGEVEDESFGSWRECVSWVRHSANEILETWGYPNNRNTSA